MALQLNDTGPLVKKWQQFLKVQGFFNDIPDGIFGPITLESTKAFQKFYNIPQTGVAGSLTLEKAYSLGFNPGNEPQPPQIDTDQKLMQWLRITLVLSSRMLLLTAATLKAGLQVCVPGKQGF
jgi:peptidoglycan hydrolase-like protein with peptidoglycan-binding domain